MKKIINAPMWRTDDGLDLPINCVKDSGCYIEILNAIYTQLTAMLSYHNKVLVVRVDIHLPDNQATNKNISSILRKFKKRLLRKGYSPKRLGYVWVREASKNGNTHYHLVYMVDGNKQQSAYNLNNLLEESVMFVDTKINIHYPTKEKSSYKIINRTNEAGIPDVFYWLSYLAKERTKGQAEPATNDYSASRF